MPSTSTRKKEPLPRGSYRYEAGNQDKVIIFFGGLAGRIGMDVPPFEFVKTTKYAAYHKIFVRDHSGAWYNRGLRNRTKNIPETVDFLRAKIDEVNVDKIVCVGNSAGGFGALMFATYLEADVCHAFSPQTIVDAEQCEEWDRRFIARMRKITRDNRIESKILDLRAVIGQSKRTKYFIHYCAKSKVDQIHATRLEGYNENITFVAIPCKNHAAVKWLRAKDLLAQVVGAEDASHLPAELLQYVL